MTQSIRAHFDGSVIVPDEPVDIPVDLPLQIAVTPLTTPDQGDEDSVADELRRLDEFMGTVSAPTIPPEALRRESMYDDRP